jgi:uncharacterized RDD family membrane protein YckC
MTAPYNPYQPPQADVNATVGEPSERLTDASVGIRFANLCIDVVGRLLFATVLGGLLVLVSGVRFAAGFSGIVFGLGSMFLYYVLFEGLFGRTLGKLVTGTRVVTSDGGKPRFLQICGRTLARFVPFEPFSFFGSGPSGWHDRWSETRVVRVRR